MVQALTGKLKKCLDDEKTIRLFRHPESLLFVQAE
jgi:hypothetical protein